MLQEFKTFIMRGNVVDLAVGVIVGGAFGKIVSSLVADIVMPPIGILLGGVDASNQFFALDGKHYLTLAEAKKAAAPTINYGLFMNAVVDFLIVSFVIFLAVRLLSRLHPPAVETRDCPFCLTTIPLKATRCGHCTSDLTTGTAE